MKVINTEKLPIKMWLNDIEDGALEQAKNLANLPFLHKWVAIMPDSHQGYGMPIGGVIATEGVVIPNAVGVDIGCGMCAVQTKLPADCLDQEDLKKIMGEIRKAVPVGFAHHQKPQEWRLMPGGSLDIPDGMPIVLKESKSALTQIGTLGGGNHFIEIQKGDDGFIWLMIHSGSRNLGLQVANFYNRVAEELNEKWRAAVPKEWQLAFLPLDSEEGKNYMSEMKYCVEFAAANRKLMMKRVSNIFSDITTFDCNGPIDIAHNYAAMENHFDKNVLVHRKGATKADFGRVGIIPGSMGTSSYIVSGLGCKQSFESCSHGAGRRMGRKEAIRTLSLEDEQNKMAGVLGMPRTQEELEEAPGAYKDIDEVMANQADLVEIKVKLKPLAVIKG